MGQKHNKRNRIATFRGVYFLTLFNLANIQRENKYIRFKTLQLAPLLSQKCQFMNFSQYRDKITKSKKTHTPKWANFCTNCTMPYQGPPLPPKTPMYICTNFNQQGPNYFCRSLIRKDKKIKIFRSYKNVVKIKLCFSH